MGNEILKYLNCTFLVCLLFFLSGISGCNRFHYIVYQYKIDSCDNTAMEFPNRILSKKLSAVKEKNPIEECNGLTTYEVTKDVKRLDNIPYVIRIALSVNKSSCTIKMITAFESVIQKKPEESTSPDISLFIDALSENNIVHLVAESKKVAIIGDKDHMKDWCKTVPNL